MRLHTGLESVGIEPVITAVFSRVRKYAVGLSISLVSSFVAAQLPETQPDAPATASVGETDIEEVLVVGEQPGPQLWQVHKGDHRLYVLAMESPLPKNMEWKSSEVEKIVAQSQEMITPPSMKFEFGFWGSIGALPALIGYRNNPDGKKLNEVLSPELYARWVALKEKYHLDDKSLEKQRPIFAANALYKQALDKIGLAPNDFIRWKLELIVKQQKIPTNRPELQHQMSDAGKKIRKFKASPLDDSACFTTYLDRLESDIDGMIARANAWARGDIETILSLPHPEEMTTCAQAIMSADFFKEEGMGDLTGVLRNAWVDAAVAALDKNTSTFAYLPIQFVLPSDGYLAALAQRGYEIDGVVLKGN